MSRALVAIVGRPNVGKSTLFNKIAGRKLAIVEDSPGVTRDRNYTRAEWLNHHFTLIDTGGIEPDSEELIPSLIKKQAQIAIEMAHVILFVVDAKAGLTSTDREVAQLLRRSKKPVVLVLNKVDNDKVSEHYYDFYELGFGDPMEISASIGLGIGDLLDEVVANFPEGVETDYEDDVIRVAIAGKPNAGKSSILNSILGEERVIVSPIAGTTRDSIDTYFEHGDDKFILIDTAGIRKKKKVEAGVEKYSVLRTVAAIDRSDVVLIVIDATEGVTEQDTKVAGIAHEEGRACIIVINKWDLVEKETNTMRDYTREVRDQLAFLSYAPVMFVSALTKQRLDKMIEKIKFVSNQHAMRVQTGVLNEVIAEAMMLNQPPSDKGKRLKIYYVSQTNIKPPGFTVFINDKELMHFSYQRYLENKIRENFGFEGTPIRFYCREKQSRY
ncbi:GTP-binding protein [Peptoclostridium litorale DSM 5388]|uniref:GTPase Der n=1 Tax=Peptoclostridium litorale DSM 5388 TaxID=1121324 RepID=A0A069RAD4_PEPLI|nr:ribosome biogenesis GTPase Der [Peptoclostridium litorale]KDR94006.1 GTPase Der [Peptoclostridium litorale DSM 5388]SIN79464.1 GTP-binding protein [Peptoclostridium litorale DSM 5388]